MSKELQDTKPKNVVLVAFNGEERGLLGSSYFADHYDTEEVVVLEMVGYFTDEPNSQEMPDILPPMPIGNFLAIIGNRNSGAINHDLIRVAGHDTSIKKFENPIWL